MLGFFAKIILGEERNAEGAEENAEDGARELLAGVPGHAVWQILRLVRLAPDFAQDDRRKTDNNNDEDRSRFLGFASE